MPVIVGSEAHKLSKIAWYYCPDGAPCALAVPSGEFDPKFQVQGVTPINHSSCQKTRMNIILHAV